MKRITDATIYIGAGAWDAGEERWVVNQRIFQWAMSGAMVLALFWMFPSTVGHVVSSLWASEPDQNVINALTTKSVEDAALAIIKLRVDVDSTLTRLAVIENNVRQILWGIALILTTMVGQMGFVMKRRQVERQQEDPPRGRR